MAWHHSPSILIRLLHLARFLTDCHHPISVLNGLKVILFAAMTKLTVATLNSCKLA